MGGESTTANTKKRVFSVQKSRTNTTLRYTKPMQQPVASNLKRVVKPYPTQGTARMGTDLPKGAVTIKNAY